jgi:hypothetical protein
MDLPPSGWYPDPYGTPSLLRWWDGSGWTQHTHPDVTAAGNGAEPAATAVQSAAVQATAVQGAVAAGADVRATTVQPATGQQATRQPSTEWLSRTAPPTGRPTAPQPALPANPESAAGVAPTAYQPAVTTVQPGVQPTVLQPAAVQATGMQATAVQRGYPQPGAGGDGAGTQVLFRGGDTWQAPGGPALPGGPGGPGWPAQGNPYGYLEAQRRRRRRLIGGVTAGTLVAAATIAIIVTSMSGSPSTPAADQSPAAPAAVTASSPSAAPSASPSAPASPTTAASESLLTDTQSGLSYPQLAAPWQGAASCPSAISNVGAFTWTDGEYAVAGTINGGSTTWYGEACSGPLPLQYGYSGVADLQGTADNLAQTFENAYYGALNHTVAAGTMGTITTTDGTEIFYKDWGSGQPIVFSHGWPLSADDWDTQMLFFLGHGYRVIAHDRRGHGRSTQTSDGHDMDHYADDLAAVTEHLDLHDADPRRPLDRRRRGHRTTSPGTARAGWRRRC